MLPKYYVKTPVYLKINIFLYPHDIRSKYCGCGCQNSSEYPRMQMRMRSSDTPLILNMTKNNKAYFEQSVVQLNTNSVSGNLNAGYWILHKKRDYRNMFKLHNLMLSVRDLWKSGIWSFDA